MASEEWERTLDELRNDNLLDRADNAETDEVNQYRNAMASKTARERFQAMFQIVEDRLPGLPAMWAARGGSLVYVHAPDTIGNIWHEENHHDDRFAFRIAQSDFDCRICRESVVVSVSPASQPDKVSRKWALGDPEKVFADCLRVALR